MGIKYAELKPFWYGGPKSQKYKESEYQQGDNKPKVSGREKIGPFTCHARLLTRTTYGPETAGADGELYRRSVVQLSAPAP
jgi:hypothetical protein